MSLNEDLKRLRSKCDQLEHLNKQAKELLEQITALRAEIDTSTEPAKYLEVQGRLLAYAAPVSANRSGVHMVCTAPARFNQQGAKYEND